MEPGAEEASRLSMSAVPIKGISYAPAFEFSMAQGSDPTSQILEEAM